MSDEERLERIIRESKGVVWNTETDEDLLTELDTPDFNWLIEQAEQNKRYREAINFAIDYLKNSDIRQVQLVVTGLKSALEESKNA